MSASVSRAQLHVFEKAFRAIAGLVPPFASDVSSVNRSRGVVRTLS